MGRGLDVQVGRAADIPATNPPMDHEDDPLNYRTPIHVFLLATVSALFGACDVLDKPIGEIKPYDACAGKACGDPCTVCDPKDKDCVEDQVVKACDASAKCVAEVPNLCVDPPPAYEPCAGKSACDACTVCDPNDKDCVEDLVYKVCDADAKCVAELPPECSPGPYAPCEGKVCGDACTLCDPNDLDCVEDQVYKTCDGQGQCVPDAPGLCGYEPCANKMCGDACTVCDPNDKDCTEDDVVKACDPKGLCVPETPGLCGAYEPCAGKSCGDSCLLCAPNDPDCVETAELKACDPEGVCVSDTGNLCL